MHLNLAELSKAFSDSGGIPVVLAGSLGALAPEIVRLYQARLKRRPEFSVYYFMVSILYALAAGALCLILPAENRRAGFYVGVTFPIFVSRVIPGKRMTLANAAPAQGIVMETAASLAAKRSLWQIVQDHAKALFL